jgi:hypothetical protein
VEQEEAAVARHWRGKHVSAATNQHATIEELLEAVFSVQSVPGLYSKDQWEKSVSQSVSVVRSCELQVSSDS